MKTICLIKPAKLLLCLLLAASLAMPACSSGRPAPTATATPPVTVGEASFSVGTGIEFGFKLLYALESFGGNNVLGVTSLAQVMAAARQGASGTTAEALARELGMQGMQPRQINDVALRMRQAVSRLKYGRFATAWCLVFGEQQYVLESYLMDCRQSLQLQAFFPESKLDNETGNKYLSEWADDNTGGRVKQVKLPIPDAPAPFFVDILEADPDWQMALDTGKSRPLPFQYENGEENAVPTMICYQNCGIYEGPEGSVAILPTAGDEARLIILLPGEGMSLREFIPLAAERHGEWIDDAQWGEQRVLLPRVRLEFSGTALPMLDKAGLGVLLSAQGDYSAMGEGLYFADVLHMASLNLDEGGVDSPDPNATYRQGIKDGIPTLAVNRPFLVMLERTGENGRGQVLVMGIVRDPLSVAGK